METILLTGATSQIGPYLINQLLLKGYMVHAVTRSREKTFGSDPRLKWHFLSNDNPVTQIIEMAQPHAWISVGPLSLVSKWLCEQKNSSIKRIIGTSSTGVLTKTNSKNEREQKSIQALLSDEKTISEKCSANNIAWTIFRPTLVYSDGRDKNISVIVSLIKKFKFFPVWNNGKGLRQPIHAEDIATAIVQSLNCEKTFGSIYVLSGGNILTYKEMVEALFLSMGKKPRIVNLPYFILAGTIASLSLIPKFRYLNTEMVSRINDDLSFDHEKAKQDFGFSPRSFTPESVSL